MARAKTSVDVDTDATTHVHDDDAALSVERTEFSQAYRFASARELISTDEPTVDLSVSSGQYMKFIGTTNDDRVVVADRQGVEFLAPTNPLDRVI